MFVYFGFLISEGIGLYDVCVLVMIVLFMDDLDFQVVMSGFVEVQFGLCL